MLGRTLDLLEGAGADLVARLLNGRAVEIDTEDAPEGTHDYDIVSPDGSHIVALEITSAADPSIVSQLHTAFGRVWSDPRLAHNWMIAIHREPDRGSRPIRHVMATMFPILSTFESLGETMVEVRASPQFERRNTDLAPALLDARCQMFDLGVTAARLWSDPEPGHSGRIFPTLSGGTSSNPGKLNELVVRCAERKVKKLLAARADARHLLVWLDTSHDDAELAFATLPPPPAPTIAAGIDSVWLAAPTGAPAGVRVWCLTPPGPWQVVDPPEGFVFNR